MDITDIFEGEWQSSGEYLIRCPICGDHPTHNHCYLNLKKRTYYCHYSGCTDSLYELIKEYKDVDLEPRQGITDKKKFPAADFSRFKKITGLESSNDRLAMSYLKGRGIGESEIEFYEMMYCADPSNRYYGRIIMPIFENKKIVCLSARSFLPFIKPPYLFPHYGETECTAGEVIWGLERTIETYGRMVVLVEGVFDAIAINQRKKFGSYGLALLNKAMTRPQLGKLLQLNKDVRFFVMLDSDAKKESLKIAKELSNYGRQVYLCLLPQGDPASISKEQYDTVMDEAKKFSDELELEEIL